MTLHFFKVMDNNKEMVRKQQILQRKEKEKHRTVMKGTDKMKEMYTKIDGIITKNFELTDYLKERKKWI